MCLLQGEQRRIPTEMSRVSAEFPSRVSAVSVRQLYAEMAKNERQSPERAQDGDEFLQEFYQGRFIFETDFFHLHISLEEVLKMQILFSCQSIHTSPGRNPQEMLRWAASTQDGVGTLGL